MNARIPTPAEFLASPASPEEDEETAPIGDPLVSIAESLRTLVSAVADAPIPYLLTDTPVESPAVDTSAMQVLVAEAARDDMEAQLYEVNGQIEAVLALCKPSTSKLANSIRAALAPPTPVEDDAPAEDDEQHVHGDWDQGGYCNRLIVGPDGAGEVCGARSLPEGVYVSPTSDATVTMGAPALNADVREWRAYARQLRGLTNGDSSIDSMTRLQIQTLLGITQPVTGQ